MTVLDNYMFRPFAGHLQVVFKRTYGPNTYNVRARDLEISPSRARTMYIVGL